MTYLYSIPKGSKIVVSTSRKPQGEKITFHHPDGMYSYCTTEDGEVVHLSVMTPLRVHGDHYHIVPDWEMDDE